ncbi:MAG: type II secretion system F family protein [Adlercreutzia sp.]|nr:type II secretion system F family protein [Adlercreutzia sp.]
MDPSLVLAFGSVGLSAVAGFLLSREWYAHSLSRARARALLDVQRESRGKAALRWHLRNGIAPLRPAAEALLQVKAVRRSLGQLEGSCEARGYLTSQVALMTMLIFAGVGCVAGGWALTQSPVFGAAIAGGALILGASAAKAEAEKRACALRDEIPDALRSIGVCFKAGLSLMQTLHQTGSEMKGPLGALFLAAARVLETGGTASEALALFKHRADAPELAFVAVALDVQHQTGGSLAPVLEAARESVEGEIELARSLKVQTAQAKLSARIVTVMPFVLIALFSFMSPGFLDPFFASVPGMVLLALALVMQVGGVMLVRRTLNVGAG